MLTADREEGCASLRAGVKAGLAKCQSDLRPALDTLRTQLDLAVHLRSWGSGSSARATQIAGRLQAEDEDSGR